jgi:hypothetical protein
MTRSELRDEKRAAGHGEPLQEEGELHRSHHLGLGVDHLVSVDRESYGDQKKHDHPGALSRSGRGHLAPSGFSGQNAQYRCCGKAALFFVSAARSWYR